MKFLNRFLKFGTDLAAPKRWRSRYVPHSSWREQNRRLRQIESGQLQMAGTAEVYASIMARKFREVA